MKMRRGCIMFFMMFCLGFTGVFSVSNIVCAKQITSTGQAEKKALKKVKNATVVESEKDYENGTLVYEIQLIKGTKEYDLVYRASDGKLISYDWEENNVNRNSNKNIITKRKCKKLAKKKVKKGEITSVVKKYDDGIDIYKVYMTKSNKKFELKFHARTGKLIEYSWKLTATNK